MLGHFGIERGFKDGFGEFFIMPFSPIKSLGCL
jgi:hypothetical protein